MHFSAEKHFAEGKEISWLKLHFYIRKLYFEQFTCDISPTNWNEFWVVNKRLEISNFNFKFRRARNVEISPLDGSFSAVSKPIFATKYSFCSIFRDLEEWHTFAPLQTHFFRFFAIFCKIFGLLQNFAEI